MPSLPRTSPSLHLDFAYVDEWFVVCEASWQREFRE
jgi:hypothetical protein